jgi:nitrogen fixation-related uncharacterized protein
MKAVGIIIVLVVVVVLFFLWSRQDTKVDDQAIRTLYRQAARYMVASLQDESEVIQVLHANYAMGYIMALRDIATDTDFTRVTGEDLDVFEHKIAVAQDVATKRLVRTRPDLVPLEDSSIMRAIYSS